MPHFDFYEKVAHLFASIQEGELLTHLEMGLTLASMTAKYLQHLMVSGKSWTPAGKKKIIILLMGKHCL